VDVTAAGVKAVVGSDDEDEWFGCSPRILPRMSCLRLILHCARSVTTFWNV